MKRRHDRRWWTDQVMRGMTLAATVAILVPLFLVLAYVIARGAGALNWNLLTQLPKPVGVPGGGAANAVVGSLIMVALGSAIAVPLGILAGVYLAEFGRGSLAGAIRFTADIMTGVPSIVIGVFINLVLVLRMGTYSAWAGGLALSLIMLPTVIRTTEEMLRLVPGDLREAALALGAPYWRTVLSIVLPTARAGLVTGVLLGVARIAGETAPLLFTALNNRYWPPNLSSPTASLPALIYRYATSPYKDWQEQAWAAALLLVVLILALNLFARFLTRNRATPTR